MPKDVPLDCLTKHLKNLFDETDSCYQAFMDYLQHVRSAFVSFQRRLDDVHRDLEKGTVPQSLRGTQTLFLGITSNAAETLFLGNFDRNFEELEKSKAEWEQQREKLWESADASNKQLAVIRGKWVAAAKERGSSITQAEQVELSKTIAPFQKEAADARQILESAIAASQESRRKIGECVVGTMKLLSGHFRVSIPGMALNEVPETQNRLQKAMNIELDFACGLEACVLRELKRKRLGDTEETTSYFDLQTQVKREAKAKLMCTYEQGGVVLPEKTEVMIYAADYRNLWTVKTKEGQYVDVPSTILELPS